MVRIISTAFAVAIALVACAPSVSVTRLGNEVEPRTETASVQVFTDRSAAPENYTEVALITVNDQGWDRDDPELIEPMIQEARGLGANGLILLGFSTRDEGGYFYGGTWFASTENVVRAVAIAYTE